MFKYIYTAYPQENKEYPEKIKRLLQSEYNLPFAPEGKTLHRDLEKDYLFAENFNDDKSAEEFYIKNAACVLIILPDNHGSDEKTISTVRIARRNKKKIVFLRLLCDGARRKISGIKKEGYYFTVKNANDTESVELVSNRLHEIAGFRRTELIEYTYDLIQQYVKSPKPKTIYDIYSAARTMYAMKIFTSDCKLRFALHSFVHGFEKMAYEYNEMYEDRYFYRHTERFKLKVYAHFEAMNELGVILQVRNLELVEKLKNKPIKISNATKRSMRENIKRG